MVQIVKSEWHQIERRYGLDIDEVILSEIYPDFTEHEINEVMKEIKSGEVDIGTILEDAESNGVYLDFDWLDEDDMWTDRKGGYEVTYQVIDEDEEVATDDSDDESDDDELEDTELYCHNCSWIGSREESVVEDELLMCPECHKPVGHVDDSEQEEASLEDLRSQLYDMMKKDD